MWPSLPILVEKDTGLIKADLIWILGDFEDLGLEHGYAFAVSRSNCLEDVSTYFEWFYYDKEKDDWVDSQDYFSLTCYTSGNAKYTAVLKTLHNVAT